MKLGFLPSMRRSQITSPDWVGRLVELLEACEVESVWAVEHLAVAEDYEPLYPYSPDGRMPTDSETSMPDPLEWLSFVAARSTRLRLGTSVVVAPLHPALTLAKRAATLDALSGGRLLLGLGLGWQKEEYEAVGVPYAERGARLDETIEAMRALWGPGPARYQGRHVRFEGLHCDVKPARPEGVPILVGGSTGRAARRAGRLGDGFFPYVISPEVLAERLESMRASALEAGRDPEAIELTVWPGSFDFQRGFDLDFVSRYAELGVHRLVVSGLEVGGPDFDDLRRLLETYQNRIVRRL